MTQETADVKALLERSESLLESLVRSPDDEHGKVLDTVIGQLLSALPLCSANDEQQSICLQRLCFAYRHKFRASLSDDDIDTAIAFGSEARNSTPKMSTEYGKVLNTLGMSLTDRWRKIGDITDLDGAIECAREAAALSPPKSYQHLVNHHGLIIRISLKFKATGALEVPKDLARTTSIILANHRPGRDVLLQAATELAQNARAKFESSRADRDLDFALDLIQPVLQGLDKNDNQIPAILDYVSNLWFVKYQRTGGDVNLSKSLEYSREASVASETSDPARNAYLLNHFKHLAILVTSTDSMEVVDSLILKDRALLEGDFTMDQDYVNTLATFGTIFAHRYRLSSSLNDLAFLINHANKFGKLIRELYKTGATQQQVDLVSLQALMYVVAYCIEESDLALPMQVTRSLQESFTEASQRVNYLEALTELAKHVSVPFFVYANRLPFATAQKAQAQPQQQSLEKDMSGQLSAPSEIKSPIVVRSPLSIVEPQTSPSAMHSHSKGNLAIDRHSGAAFWDLSRRWVGEDDDFPESLPPDQFRERYNRLEHESRAKEEARGERPDLNLCRICRFTKVIQDNQLSSKQHPGRYIFGNRDELSCRQHCSICRLVMRLITSGPDMELHPQLGPVERDVRGVQLSAQITSSGESVMAVQIALRAVGTIRLLTKQNYMLALRQSHEINSAIWELGESSGLDPHLNRLDQTINTDLIRKMLDDCQTNHKEPCTDSNHSRRQDPPRQLLVIDVREQRLTNLPAKERYLALSYVWGQGIATPVTLLSNLTARRIANSLSITQLPELPLTIRDAFVFTQNLGERFLWVDALCIVQDDPDSKHNAIARMDEVYGGAYATIVAAHGANANAGLPGVRKGTRESQLITTIQSHQENRRLNLVATPPKLGFMLSMSTWDSRGWTFQERILSKRCIYFTRDFFYFHCPCVQLCEVESPDSIPPKTEYIKKPETRTIGLSGNPLYTPINPEDALVSHGPMKISRTSLFRTYRQLIEMYSSRSLSVDSDAIHAVSGIFAALQKQHHHRRFFHGLPSATIDLALLWLPEGPLQRRPCLDAQGRHSFPTWSWAGWKGSVQHRLIAEDIEKEGKGDTLPESLIDTFELAIDDQTTITLARRPNGLFEASNNPTNLAFKAESTKSTTTTLRFQASAIDAATFKLDFSLREELASSSHAHARGTQSVVHLLDSRTRRCGVLFLPPLPATPDDSNMTMQSIAATRGDLDFVAMSQYRNIRALPVVSTVEKELKWLDDQAFSAEEGSGEEDVGRDEIIVALLVENHGAGAATRVSIAVIHSRAWRDAGPRKREVNLL